MLRPDKLKSPDLVGHEPFLVSRPEESTRKMQSPKYTKAPNPHRYRGLYLHEVSKEIVRRLESKRPVLPGITLQELELIKLHRETRKALVAFKAQIPEAA
jgi:hypothetical protein